MSIKHKIQHCESFVSALVDKRYDGRIPIWDDRMPIDTGCDVEGGPSILVLLIDVAARHNELFHDACTASLGHEVAEAPHLLPLHGRIPDGNIQIRFVRTTRS